MDTRTTRLPPYRLTQTFAFAALVLAALASMQNVRASEVRPPSIAPQFANASLADLESAFWTCDYVATTHGPSGDVERCVAAYETLKQRKFDGDFDALVAWWQVHKPEQHQRLESRLRLGKRTASK